MINKDLDEIITTGRLRRTKNIQAKEDIVNAARNRNPKRHFPGDFDAPYSKCGEPQSESETYS